MATLRAGRQGSYSSGTLLRLALLLGAAALALALARSLAPRAAGGAACGDVRRRYLDTVKLSVTGVLLETPALTVAKHSRVSELGQEPYDAEKRRIGRDWPQYGLAMTGVLRLENVQQLLERALQEGVPGDFVECGVWRGGTSLFARAVLFAHGVVDRQVHLVDSFQGLPKASTANDEDFWSEMAFLRVSQEAVRASFERYGLLDEQVRFHQGFFREALPRWRKEVGRPIAVLRLDGDMYESTVDELYNLWDLVSLGGWVIVDDYTMVPACKKGVDEFRERHAIRSPLLTVDGDAVYFQKTSGDKADAEWYARFNAQRTR